MESENITYGITILNGNSLKDNIFNDDNYILKYPNNNSVKKIKKNRKNKKKLRKLIIL